MGFLIWEKMLMVLQTSLSECIVLKLMDPYLGRERCVTTDNFFTSIKLAKNLANKKTSIVGTLNCIRTEVPQEIKVSKAPVHSNKVLKNNNVSVTVYQEEAKKNPSSKYSSQKCFNI